MKKVYLYLLFAIAMLPALAQTYSVQWGEETKLKKGSVDFDIVNADETGVYVVEGKIRMKSYFVIGATYGTDHRLIKFDKNYNDVFTQDYRKELKGLNYKGIQFLKKDMFLFADDYIKREKRYIVYGTKINRATGLASGEMKELASFQLDSKKDDFEYGLIPNADSSQWLLIGDVSSEENVAISVTVLDKQLNVKSTTPIRLSFPPNSFTLEDVLLTKDNKFLVVGRQFDQVPVGKRNRTRRTFTKYIFSKYNSKGQKELDFPTDIGEHFAMNGRAIQLPDGGLSFAGFYSNNRKKTEVNGVFVYRLDVVNGTVLQSSFKELSEGMLDQAVEDEADMDNDLKKEKKEREKAKEEENDDDGLSRFLAIRGIEYNPVNGSLLLIAELSTFEQYSVMNSSYNAATKSYSNSWTTYYRYTNSDLMVINTNNKGEIEWVNTLPKKQVETIQSGRTSRPGISVYSDPTSLFARGGGMPFYSSFSYMLLGNKLIFLLNDHAQNGHVQKLSDKTKVTFNFKKSVAYAVSLDLGSGLFTRKLLLSNEDDPVLMPRLGFVVGKEFFLPAMKMKAFGKTEFKIGKVSVRGGEM